MSIPPILLLTDVPAPGDPQFYLDAATASVRSFCGWHVTPVISESLVLDGSGDDVLQLPSRHVTSVESVTDDGVLVDVDWSADGLLRRKDGRCWTRRYGAVSVDLTHGHTDAADIAGVIVGIASRAATNPSGNVVNQRAGTQSFTLATVGGASASIPLLATEKELLEPYRLNWGP